MSTTTTTRAVAPTFAPSRASRGSVDARARWRAGRPARGGGGAGRPTRGATMTTRMTRGRARARRSTRVCAAMDASDGARVAAGGKTTTETEGNRGWCALEVWRNLGLTWNFITASSPEGKQVIKAAHASAGNKLKGISTWRKAMWDEASKRAPITFLDSHTPLPGCRGYRVCWANANDMPAGQKRPIVMFYVQATRRFYFEADVARGAIDAEEVDATSYKTPRELLEAQERIFNINQTFAEVYADMLEADKQSEGKEWETFEQALVRQVASGGAPVDVGDDEDDDVSPAETWAKGRGVSPSALYTQMGVHYDFHGPSGTVSRSIISTVGAARGLDTSGADSWRKEKWLAAAAELRVTSESTHANLSAVGRGWKVCWIEDGSQDVDAPTVLVWAPEAGEYFSLGAIKAKGSCAGQPMDAVLSAIVAVARSEPQPIGLKEALARDHDFLVLIGRAAPDASKRSTVEPSADANASFDDSEEGTVYVEVDDDDEDDDEDEDEDDYEDEEINVRAMLDDDDEDDDFDYTGPSSWTSTGASARSDAMAAEKFILDDDDVFAPGFDPSEDPLPSSVSELGLDGVPAQDQFYSRSAGYLSFVEDEFNDDDLKRELGIDRDDMYRGPKDFPDLSENPTPTPTETTTVSLREASPQGLPKPADAYHALELDGIDFIVSKMNDGRLDLREVYVARRDGYGRFVEEARRVDTSAFMSLPPAYYQEIAWTEVRVKNEEDFDSGRIPNFNTTEERTTKVFLIFANNAPSLAYDRALDFTKPVVQLTSEDGSMTAVAVGGATSNPNASLVIKDGELYCLDASEMPTFTQVIEEYEDSRTKDGPTTTAEFLAETDTDIEAQAFDEEEDTPDVDQI